jgi:hypothetical protein
VGLGERSGDDDGHVAPVAVDRPKIETDSGGNDQQIDERSRAEAVMASGA